MQTIAPVSSDLLQVVTVSHLALVPASPHIANQQDDPFKYFCLQGPGHLLHAAFHTAAQSGVWLALRGLARGPGLTLVGSYRIAVHRSLPAFGLVSALGTPFRLLDHGDYTRAIATHDADGVTTVHLVHPDCPRELFDPRESEGLDRAGRCQIAAQALTMG